MVRTVHRCMQVLRHCPSTGLSLREIPSIWELLREVRVAHRACSCHAGARVALCELPRDFVSSDEAGGAGGAGPGGLICEIKIYQMPE